MKLQFYKYQGAGNDFVMLDSLKDDISLNTKQVAHICDRHFGIGADGLIILKPDNSSDFYMEYYNSDGKESSMCGNGGRCIVKFAHDLGFIKNKASFKAIDGMHQAWIKGEQIQLEMIPISKVERFDDDFVLDSGSPHYVSYTTDLEDFALVENAQKIRYSEPFKKEGINVNFVQVLEKNSIFVRTYERGVEAETLACGTGVVASVITYAKLNDIAEIEVKVKVLGGTLKVYGKKVDGVYKNIILEGPAVKAFQGTIEL